LTICKVGSYPVARINFRVAGCDGKLRAASGRNPT
jgi:hypothetical protein